MNLIYNEETEMWEEYQEPYCSLDIATEEDWKIFEEAIKKQQAQKPDYEGDGVDNDGNIVYDAAFCPRCHREFEVDYDSWMDYCPKCGQKLDWSEGKRGIKMDCNKTEIFFKELTRMCNKYRCTKYNASCSGCEIYQHCYDSSCYGFIKNNPLKAVEIVQKWSDEHPIKTRQSEFLNVFPKSKLEKGVLPIRPCIIEGECINLDKHECGECRQEYWLSEAE